MGDADTSLATTAFVQSAVAPALNDVGRNKLHNGLMNIWQRGTGTFAASGYTADRWLLGLTLDTSNAVQGIISDAQRTQIGDEAAKQALVVNIAGNAGVGAYTILMHRIEDVHRLSGKTMTLSFWAWTGSGTLKLGASFDQVFGSGGSPSATVNLNGQSVTLSTTISRYTLTFTLPSVSGTTLGTNGNDFHQLNFWFSAGSSFAARSGSVGVQSGAIGLWGIQLEIGSVASPLEKLDPRLDLANCQRFYQTLRINIWGVGVSGNPSFAQQFSLPVTMRASPTATALAAGNLNGCSSPSYDTLYPDIIRASAVMSVVGTAYWTGAQVGLSADL